MSSALRTVVLDASALLSLLQDEPGADEVEGMLDGALMSSVNLSEVLQKAEQHGVGTEGLEYDLEALGVEFRDFERAMARPAAELWSVHVRANRRDDLLGRQVLRTGQR